MRDALKYFILSLVLVGAAGTIYYTYENNKPCVNPVRYRVGTVDSQFGISRSAVLADAEFSAAIWNKAAGKTVLEYDPKGDVPINFVYDTRQANAQLGSQIASEQAQDDELGSQIDALKAQYASMLASYNQAVSAANARGGARPSEYAALEAQRGELQALTDQINAQVGSYNAAVRATNAQVQSYNQSAGKTFKEGEYVQDQSGKSITIFEFTNATQLERVLAHEMGHAIGLDHNANPKSIMYAENESGNLTPTGDDLAALQALCGTK